MSVKQSESAMAMSTAAAIQNEVELLRRLRAGEDRAFEQLVRECGQRMMATARRLLGNDDDAADAVQEAFGSAFKSLDRFEGTSRLSTWLHRITMNCALMKLRARRRRPEVSIDSLMPTFAADGHRMGVQPAWTSSAGDLLESEETRQLVRERIAQLPDDHRQVLILRDIDGLDTAETARVLNISEGAVKTRLHRARMALRELMESDFGHHV